MQSTKPEKKLTVSGLSKSDAQSLIWALLIFRQAFDPAIKGLIDEMVDEFYDDEETAKICSHFYKLTGDKRLQKVLQEIVETYEQMDDEHNIPTILLDPVLGLKFYVEKPKKQKKVMHFHPKKQKNVELTSEQAQDLIDSELYNHPSFKSLGDLMREKTFDEDEK